MTNEHGRYLWTKSKCSKRRRRRSKRNNVNDKKKETVEYAKNRAHIHNYRIHKECIFFWVRKILDIHVYIIDLIN